MVVAHGRKSSDHPDIAEYFERRNIASLAESWGCSAETIYRMGAEKVLKMVVIHEQWEKSCDAARKMEDESPRHARR